MSMLKGVHDILHKIGKKEPEVVLDPTLTPILSAKDLLADEKYQEIIREITKLSGAPIHDFNRLYLKVIHNFVEFVQQLPETRGAYYAYKGGLLDHGLDRTYRALTLCRAYLLPAQERAVAIIPRQQALWVYAVFTASLLLDIGKATTKLYIDLFDHKGAVLKRWVPFEGAMTLKSPPASYYRFDFEKENRERLRYLTTPLLARQLLPLEGFNWIASDKDILESWLAMLEDDQSGGGLIPSVIPLADAHSLDAEFGKIKAIGQGDIEATTIEGPKESPPQEPAATTMGTTIGATTETGQPLLGGAGLPTVATVTTTMMTGTIQSRSPVFLTMGTAFLRWLQNGLKGFLDNTHQLKEVKITLEKGLPVIPPQVYNKFLKENPQYGKDPHTVAQAFKQCIDSSAVTVDYRHYANDATSKIVKNATMVTNVFLLFPDVAQRPMGSENIVLLTSQAQTKATPVAPEALSQAIKDQFIAPKPTT